MAGTPRNGPVDETMGQWMRGQEKRTMHEERRPRVTKASDLLGPGFAPTATHLDDWNSEEARFNGFFFSTGLALNAPHPTANIWMGFVVSTGHHAVQTVYRHGQGVIEHWARNMHIHGNALPTYEAWVKLG